MYGDKKETLSEGLTSDIRAPPILKRELQINTDQDLLFVCSSCGLYDSQIPQIPSKNEDGFNYYRHFVAY